MSSSKTNRITGDRVKKLERGLTCKNCFKIFKSQLNHYFATCSKGNTYQGFAIGCAVSRVT